MHSPADWQHKPETSHLTWRSWLVLANDSYYTSCEALWLSSSAPQGTSWLCSNFYVNVAPQKVNNKKKNRVKQFVMSLVVCILVQKTNIATGKSHVIFHWNRHGAVDIHWVPNDLPSFKTPAMPRRSRGKTFPICWGISNQQLGETKISHETSIKVKYWCQISGYTSIWMPIFVKIAFGYIKMLSNLQIHATWYSFYIFMEHVQLIATGFQPGASDRRLHPRTCGARQRRCNP